MVSTAQKYGQMHGTAFWYNNDIADSFLKYMKSWLGDNWADYSAGFMEGLMGECVNEYPHLKPEDKP